MEGHNRGYTCRGIHNQVKYGEKWRSYINDRWMEIGRNTEKNTGGIHKHMERHTWRDTYEGRREGVIYTERPRYIHACNILVNSLRPARLLF